MTLKHRTKPILNKSHLKIFISLIFLIFYFVYCLNCTNAQVPSNTRDTIETIVKPEMVSIGDTVSVKVRKTNEEKDAPKIYFEKTKLPVFILSEGWYRALVPLSADFKPGAYPIEIFYKGGLKKINLTVKATRYPLQELTLSKEVASLKASRIEKDLVAKALSIKSNEKLWNGKFIYPSQGPQSTGYGVKRKINGVINPDYFHKGLDFAAANGSEIRAPENGKVILAGTQSKGFVVNGNCIFLDHGHGVVTGYLHLSKILVKEGDFVKKGQVIGKVGSSGIASGPHLHWGVYVLGKTVDPIAWTSMTIE